MDENLMEQNDIIEDFDVVETNVPVEDITDEVTPEEIEHDVIVELEDDITVDISESMGWVSGDSRYHDSLLGVDFPNQHPITAISNLREELDEIKRLKTVYSDKKGNADYYEWADGNYGNDDRTGLFVTLDDKTRTISICTGDDIFGVIVDGAGFVGGKDVNAPSARYGLVATTGAVNVRCELDVNDGDYVVSNRYGVACTSKSGRGYKVVALDTINGVPHAIIQLSISADQIDSMGAELQILDDRVDAAETNIVVAINTANEAYQMAANCDASNKDISDKVDGALGTVDKVVTDVENLGSHVSNAAVIAAQAKAIAESAATSAESMRNEAVKQSNEALAETSKLRNEFNDKIDGGKADIDETKKNLDSLIADLQPLSEWESADGTKHSFNGFVSQSNENASELALISGYEYKDANGNVVSKGMAGLVSQVEKNKAEIDLIVSFEQGDTEGVAGLIERVSDHDAQLETLASWKTDQTEAVATISRKADSNKSEIDALTRWKSDTVTTISGISAKAGQNEAQIKSLTSWQDETKTAMARIEQKADANGAYIQSTVANMDKYSVGPHSQAYGFTLEQATSVLEEGMIYVPTTLHTEEYKYDDDKQTYTRTFTPQYLYKWGKIGDRYGWITVDKNHSETTETNTSAKAVYFTTAIPTVSGDFGYWYTDGDNVAEGYEAHSLYKWTTYPTKDDDGKTTTVSCWVLVATLAGNSQSRAVSQVKQTANSIETSVMTLDDKYAGTKTWVDDNKSAIQATVTWKNDNAESISTFMQEAGDNFASASQVAKIVDKNGNINAASIVTAVNDSGSSVVIEADHLQFSGESFNVAIKGPIDEAVDNINIGGSNLLSKAKMGVDLKTITSNSKSGFGYICPANTTAVTIFGMTSDLDLNPDTEYTVSFVTWLDTTDTSAKQKITWDLWPDTLPQEFLEVTSTPTKHSWTISSPLDDMLDAIFRIFVYEADASGYYAKYPIYVADIKIEEGNKATDWTPAVEDMASVDYVSGKLVLEVREDENGKYAYLGGNADKIKFDATKTIEINATNFTLDSEGHIVAKSGEIGEWTLSDGMLSYGTLGKYDSFFLTAKDTYPSVTIIGNTKTNWRLGIGNWFGVDSTGQLFAYSAELKNATITGDNGTKGTFTRIKDGEVTNASLNWNLIDAGTNSGYSVAKFTTGKLSFERVNTDISNQSDTVTFSWLPDASGAEEGVYNGTYSCLFDIFAQRGKLSGTWQSASPIISQSWRGAKYDIEDLSDKYSVLFDNLRPVRHKYIDGTSGRYHTGFILDELKDAMDIAGVETNELAAYCVDNEETGAGGIRYSELVALNISETQKLKTRTAELEAKIAELEAKFTD